MTDDEIARSEAGTDDEQVETDSHESSAAKIVGTTTAVDDPAVVGHNTATSGASHGVEGTTDSPDGYGLATPDDARVGGGLHTTGEHAVTVDGDRALSLGTPASDGNNVGGGNVVAGHPVNEVTNSAVGVTISGGGYGDGNGNPYGQNAAGADYATVGGGSTNSANGVLSTIGGGSNNSTSASQATVAGGTFNEATGSQSAIAGGQSNVAGGDHSAVGGGINNEALGYYAAIPGGDGNVADGLYSFAAGKNADTNGNDGAIVWSDGDTGTTRAGAPNQFVVGTDGGVYLGDDGGPSGDFHADESKLIETSSGAHLTTGGTWAENSSRAVKEDVEPVDGGSVLERVESLPVSEWSYEDGADGVRHLGPMAEDFHDAFGLGADDEHLAALDTAGVALAAIQGLAERRRRDNERLEAENEALRDRLEDLEARVDALDGATTGEPVPADD